MQLTESGQKTEPSTLSRKDLIAAARARQRNECEEAIEHCKKDCWYWLTTWTKTYDEHAESKGENVYKPFPDKTYLQAMLEILKDPAHSRVFVAKSREMMLSWLVAGFITWECQFKPRTRWIIQSKDEDTASEIIGYCKNLYNQQPEWMRLKFPLAGGRLTTDGGMQSKLLHLYAHESRIKGVPSGAHKIRQAHPTGIFFDEAGFIDEFEAAYASGNNVTPKIIAISSAIPGGFFAQVCGG